MVVGAYGWSWALIDSGGHSWTFVGDGGWPLSFSSMVVVVVVVSFDIVVVVVEGSHIIHCDIGMMLNNSHITITKHVVSCLAAF